MHALAKQLTNTNRVRLAVATTYLGDRMQTHYDDNISYYILPRKRDSTKYDQSLETYWIKVVAEFNPDVIHIHGTEYAHGLACMMACPTRNYVISIQGMVSVYSEYHFAGINPIELLKFSTLNDLKRMDTVLHRRSEMVQRGKFEIEYIKRTKHIIGRTSWDYAHTQTINPTSISNVQPLCRQHPSIHHAVNVGLRPTQHDLRLNSSPKLEAVCRAGFSKFRLKTWRGSWSRRLLT